MPYTVPNQRVVTIHREKARSDFLGIKNENWQSAARDLGAHALLLYLYLASNADGYDLALSPTAIRQAVGMARSTYHDQFARLIDKGYLVETGGSTYDFYEVPQTRPGTPLKKAVSADGLNSEEYPSAVTDREPAVHSIPGEDIEINNTTIPTDNNGIGEKEGEYIRANLPVLNSQIPKAEDWHKYEINEIAKTITLSEILELQKKSIQMEQFSNIHEENPLKNSKETDS